MQDNTPLMIGMVGLALAGCSELPPPNPPPPLAPLSLTEPAARTASVGAKHLLAGEILLDRTATNPDPIFEPTPTAAPPAPAPEPVKKAPDGPRSEALPSGFFNPMPGGVFAGYQADTGLDIGGYYLPVYALAAGTLDYSEPGHTLWVGPRDTANTIRFELDEPIPYKGRLITHVWYAHLSKLEHHQEEGAAERRHVEGGELLGISGTANGSPHLHIGLLLDGEVEQYWGTYLKEDEVREVLGGYRNRQRLPAWHPVYTRGGSRVHLNVGERPVAGRAKCFASTTLGGGFPVEPAAEISGIGEQLLDRGRRPSRNLRRLLVCGFGHLRLAAWAVHRATGPVRTGHEAQHGAQKVQPPQVAPTSAPCGRVVRS